MPDLIADEVVTRYLEFHQAREALQLLVGVPADPQVVEAAETAYAATAAALAEAAATLAADSNGQPELGTLLAGLMHDVDAALQLFVDARQLQVFLDAREDLNAILGHLVDAGVAERIETAYHATAQELAVRVDDRLSIHLAGHV